MSEVSVTIEATPREGRGKSYTRKLRRAGKIPANFYEKGQSTAIELDPKLLPKAWTAGGKKFQLTFKGQTREVLIKELQLDPVRRLALHVDLVPV